MTQKNAPYFIPGIHIFIWAVLLAIPAIMFSGESTLGLPENFFLLTNIYNIGLFYLNAYILYPRLLNQKYWWLYMLSIAGLLAFSYYAKLFLLNLSPGFQLTEQNIRVIFFPPVPFLIASFIFRLVSNRIRFEKLEKERRAERLSSELKFLRSQVSPHFLFNMMANMVALARQKSDLLEPALIKLSDLLRYMLYDSNEEKFPVNKEIELLKNYIDLQQLRFGEDVTVRLEIKNECPGCFIEPLLLIPFIENAFKHGIGMVKDPFISIQINVKAQQLFFKIANNYNSNNLSKDKSSGIGMVNVKNRLELLYKGKYKLHITDEEGIYAAQLNLILL